MVRLATVLAALLFVSYAHAEDPATPSATRDPASVKRTVQSDDGMGPSIPDAFDQEMQTTQKRKKDTTNLGIQLSLYWDPVTAYDKFNPYGGPGNFAEQTASGNLFGMQALLVYHLSEWEIASGIDYVFPIAAQGQGTAYGNYVVTNQNINIFGVKALQVGYRFHAGGFNIVPYGGIGFYYGRDIMNLSISGQNDQVIYSKFMCNFIAGTRAEYVFTGSPRFALGGAAELFVPTKLDDQLSQNGGTTGELPGYESNMQSNLDFMSGIGARIMANASVYF